MLSLKQRSWTRAQLDDLVLSLKQLVEPEMLLAQPPPPEVQPAPGLPDVSPSMAQRWLMQRAQRQRAEALLGVMGGWAEPEDRLTPGDAAALRTLLVSLVHTLSE